MSRSENSGSRFGAIANRAVPPEYVPRARLEFAAILVVALALLGIAVVAVYRDSALDSLGLGLLAGFVSYGVARLLVGRRLFFYPVKRFAPMRLASIAFVVALALSSVFYPDLLRMLYGATWLLFAAGTHLALQAAEGNARKEWEQ